MIEKESIVEAVDMELQKSTGKNNVDIRAKEWADADINTPTVRAVGKRILKQLKTNGLDSIDKLLDLCDALLATNAWPHRIIAFQWSFKFRKDFEPRHFRIFERWVKKHVTGWGSCDDLCTHTVGYFILEYPQFIPKVKQWVNSDNPFVRRAAAVSFIYALRKGKLFGHVFDVADALLNDEDKYVLKGYGWMLKVSSKHYQDKIFEYVMENKARMPRLSLRYAIEKMPESLRKKAMASP